MFYRLYTKLVNVFFNRQSRFTKEEALKIARDYNLEQEVKDAMRFGFTPDEALEDWDIYPYNYQHN